MHFGHGGGGLRLASGPELLMKEKPCSTQEEYFYPMVAERRVALWEVLAGKTLEENRIHSKNQQKFKQDVGCSGEGAV